MASLSLVLLALAIVSPFIFLDTAWYRLPEYDNGCEVNPNTQWGYLAFLQIVYYDVPILGVIAMYPFLCYKHLKRAHRRPSALIVHKEHTPGNYGRTSYWK